MTLLEYVIANDLGGPLRCASPGESYWPCPVCRSEKFHTLPWKPEFKHRFMCWRCQFRGDVMDWLKENHPDESFTARLHRLETLRREYKDVHGTEPLEYSPPGTGRFEAKTPIEPEQIAGALAEVFALINEGPAEWIGGERELDVLRTFAVVAEIADQHRMPLDVIAGAAAKYVLKEKVQRKEPAGASGNGRVGVRGERLNL